jgi:hypothetical protein
MWGFAMVEVRVLKRGGFWTLALSRLSANGWENRGLCEGLGWGRTGATWAMAHGRWHYPKRRGMLAGAWDSRWNTHHMVLGVPRTMAPGAQEMPH